MFLEFAVFYFYFLLHQNTEVFSSVFHGKSYLAIKLFLIRLYLTLQSLIAHNTKERKCSYSLTTCFKSLCVQRCDEINVACGSSTLLLTFHGTNYLYFKFCNLQNANFQHQYICLKKKYNTMYKNQHIIPIFVCNFFCCVLL